MKYKLVFLVLLAIPLSFGYELGDYTDGRDLFVLPGSEIKLVLPFPKGENCLPVAVLYVRGGKDYPEININGKVVIGSGVHRVLLKGEEVRIVVKSSSPAFVDANSLFYCTEDPFVEIAYYPPTPIKIGTYNYVDIVMTNYGFSPAEVNVLLPFHPNLTPYDPPRVVFVIPPRSRASTSIFLLASPITLKPSAHPRACVTYRDSLGKALVCDGPVPTRITFAPRLTCVGELCYNTSNIIVEVSGRSLHPGEPLPEQLLDKNSQELFEIVKIPPTLEYEHSEQKVNHLGWVFILIGVAITGLLSVEFK